MNNIKSVIWHPPRPAGAICPKCGRYAPVVRTLPPEPRYRIRYHRCECGKRFKSVEHVG
jgi:hypothetical protein